MSALEQELRSLLGVARLSYTKQQILAQRSDPLSQESGLLVPAILDRRIMRTHAATLSRDAEWLRAKPSPEAVLIQERAKQTSARLAAERDEEEVLARNIKITLNKLCVGNMPKLLKKLFDLARNEEKGSELLTTGIFDKACSEAKFTQLYAELCQGLEREFLEAGLVDRNAHGHLISLFKKAIVRNCQAMFESVTDGETADKAKVLGNVRFIGELYKAHLLGPKVLLECIRDLIDVQLRTLKRFSISELRVQESRLEGVCVLLPIVIQTPEVAPQVRSLLNLLQKIREDRSDISPRIKVLLLVRST